METQDGLFEGDNEGQTLVNAINERLPPKASPSLKAHRVTKRLLVLHMSPSRRRVH